MKCPEQRTKCISPGVCDLLATEDLEEPVDDPIILAFNKLAVHKLHNVHVWFKVEFSKW